MLFRLMVVLCAAAATCAAVDLKDVEFARPNGVVLTLDGWIPASARPQPAVIMVHGGSWNSGDKRTYIGPWFPALTDAGIAWFTINYRLSPQWKFPAAVEDVEAAVSWVRANAAKYNVDPERLALMGESAGGHLVALVGARGKVKVKGVVDFYGPNDLVALHPLRRGPGALTAFLGDDTLETFTKASPSTYVHKGMPEYLFVHGTGDKLVAWQQSPAMCDKMKAAGAACEVFLIEGAPHGVSGWDKEPAYQGWKAKVTGWLKAKL